MITKIFRILMALAMALTPIASIAQTGSVYDSTVAFQYDLDSTSEIFVALSPFAISGPVAVTAAGSVTLTGTGAFASVAVGDYIKIIETNGTSYERSVVARASADSITISGSAITVTGARLQYKTMASTTTLASSVGEFPVSPFDKTSITFEIAQEVSTSIDVRLVCRTSPSAAFVQVIPALTPPAVAASYLNYTGTGSVVMTTQDSYYGCKIGMKINTDDGNDLTTNAEQVNISVRGRS